MKFENFRYSPPDDSFKSVYSIRKKSPTSLTEQVEEEPEKLRHEPVSSSSELDDEKEIEERFDTIFDVADTLPPAALILRFISELNVCDQQSLVNRRLTNKLVWQLQDALSVCSGAIPCWCFRIVREFPFLFPYETRQVLFSSTAFSVSRSLYRFYELEAQNSQVSRGFAGVESILSSGSTPPPQLKRQKVSLPRSHALETGIKLMTKFAGQKIQLNVEFTDEIGHGLGPTLEFYSIISREIQRKDLHLWRSSDNIVTKEIKLKVETIDEMHNDDFFVHNKSGLFPAILHLPTVNEDIKNRVYQLFKFLGRFLGRALMDDRSLDLDFSSIFLEKLMSSDLEDDEDYLPTLAEIDPELARNLQYIYNLALEYQVTRSATLREELEQLQIENLVPGSSIQVLPDESNSVISIENAARYCQTLARIIINDGVRFQINACIEGFQEIFSTEHLRAFTSSELRDIFCGGGDDIPWDISDISQNIILRDYSKDSPTIVNLLEVLSEFEKPDRRLFLKFLTGAPRLPVGGWKNLKPKFSIVKKSCQDLYQTLPSCSTCSVVLKLPQYPTKEILREKILFAIREGQNYFAMD